MEIAYDIQPSTQDPKKRSQFESIFDKICAIGEICGFEFVQNKAKLETAPMKNETNPKLTDLSRRSATKTDAKQTQSYEPEPVN